MKRKVVYMDGRFRAIVLTVAGVAALAAIIVNPVKAFLCLVVIIPLYLLVASNRLFTSRRLFESGQKVNATVKKVRFIPREYLIEYTYEGRTFVRRYAMHNFPREWYLQQDQSITLFVDPQDPETFAVLEGSGFQVDA